MKLIFLNTWHSRLHKELRHYIEQNSKDTDVFCFMEAYEEDQRVYADVLLKEFTAYSVQRHIRETGSQYGNVIYVRNTLDVEKLGNLFMEEAQRMDIGLANYVVLKTQEGSVAVCTVHGAPYPGDKLDTDIRVYQTKTLIEEFAGYDKTVIAGDFNLLPETKSIKLFSEHGYQDLIHDYAIKTTRNHHAFNRYPDNIQYHADYAFASPGVTVQNFVVPEDIVSDHQPLEVYIDIPC